ncbi:MAG: Nif3-like dinuclear metal center hexameric protein [Actinobacteria bacterium]|nr:Nif3-like dinuclear metal center hexameric protein [Actinomycetota bacterium]
MSSLTLEQITNFLDETFPANTAADWDSVGLVVGAPENSVERILLTVDVTQATVQQAIDEEASLIIAHHPLLLRGVTSIAETTNKGMLVSQLLRHKIALYTAHTNADSAWPGVSDALAETIGLAVRPEAALEVESGIGRIGELAASMTAQDFAHQIAESLPKSPSAVQVAGDTDKLIKTVAVCGGAGDSLLEAVSVLGVDAYVTSDLRHHVASEFVATNDCVLINIAHWAGEWPWLNQLARQIHDTFGDKVKVIVSQIPTDPWAISIARS